MHEPKIRRIQEQEEEEVTDFSTNDETGTFVRVPLTPNVMKDKSPNAAACTGLAGKIYKAEEDTTFQSGAVQKLLKIAQKEEVNFLTAKDLMFNVE